MSISRKKNLDEKNPLSFTYLKFVLTRLTPPLHFLNFFATLVFSTVSQSACKKQRIFKLPLLSTVTVQIRTLQHVESCFHLEQHKSFIFRSRATKPKFIQWKIIFFTIYSFEIFCFLNANTKGLRLVHHSKMAYLLFYVTRFLVGVQSIHRRSPKK